MSSTTFRASCLCGQVRWEVLGRLQQPDTTDPRNPLPFLFFSHCHCSRCRKAHGAPYATYLVVPDGRLRITHGHEHIEPWKAGSGVTRPFCRVCGGVVPDGVASHGYVSTPAGPFDDDLGVVPTAHIFVASRAPWVEIFDDLPRFDAYPEGLGARPLETRAPLDPDTGETRGSCLCGAVSYVVGGPVLRCRTCHCSRCRKAGGAAHVSYLVTPFDGLRFTRGEGMVTTYEVPGARYFKHAFCGQCGSSMPRKDVERGLGIVPMGSLDDAPGVKPSSHIYVGSAARWDVIRDGLPQYAEGSPILLEAPGDGRPQL
jgi:hypothetical protein